MPSFRSNIRSRGNGIVKKGVKFASSPALLNVGIVGVAVFIVYELYKKFFATSAFGTASNNADTAAAAHLTNLGASEGSALDALTASMSAQGLIVGALHRDNANLLNAYLDSASVDHAQVMDTIQGMSKQAFQLVAIAYGQRELRNYRNSMLHLFNPATWQDLFSEKKMYGTLKYHLGIVMSSEELSMISSYLTSVP